MNFLDQMRADLDAIYTNGEFAEEITHNGTTVLAMVGDAAGNTEQYPAVRGASLSLSVRVSEVAEVANGDAMVVRGSTYKVIGDPTNDRLEWSVNLALNKVVVSL